MSEGHAAIVLAAGGSRRLGHPKQLLTRDSETLLHRAVRLAHETGPSKLVVVIGAHDAAMAAVLEGLKCEVLVNPDWPLGISSSLECAAQRLHAYAHAGQTVVLGCDQPALEADHLRRLLQGAAHAASGCAATAHDGRLGIPAVISMDVLQQAHTLAGDRGFGNYLNALASDSIWRLVAPELQFDIDTPENEQAAIARGLLDA